MTRGSSCLPLSGCGIGRRCSMDGEATIGWPLLEYLYLLFLHINEAERKLTLRWFDYHVSSWWDVAAKLPKRFAWARKVGDWAASNNSSLLFGILRLTAATKRMRWEWIAFDVKQSDKEYEIVFSLMHIHRKSNHDNEKGVCLMTMTIMGGTFMRFKMRSRIF